MTRYPARSLRPHYPARPRATRTGLALLAGFVLFLSGCEGCETGTVTGPGPVPPLDSLTLSPSTDTLRVGQQRMFSVTAVDTGGAVVTGGGFDWSSTEPEVFTVNNAGLVTARGEGWGYLIVSGGGLADSATVSVYPDTGWFVQPSGTFVDLNGVFFQPDGRTGFAVGDGGVIRATTDAGVTWASRFATTAFNLNGIHFADATHGWIAGSVGALLRTTDGGATWTRVNAPASEALNDVFVLSATVAVAVGNSGIVVRTTNGSTWTRVLPSRTAANLRSVGFDAAGNGWAAGDGGTILGTHDAGASWYVYLPAVTAQGLDALWRRDSVRAWAVGPQGTVLRATAGPDSALWQASGIANFQLYGVHFPADATGYAAGYSTLSGAGAVLRSDDGGLTWDSQASHTNFRLNDVYFVDALRGWAVGNGGVVVHTARGGRQ